VLCQDLCPDTTNLRDGAMTQRGLVLGYPITKTEDGFSFTPSIDIRLVRKYLLYWDIIDWVVDEWFQTLDVGLRLRDPELQKQLEENVEVARKRFPNVPRETIKKLAVELQIKRIREGPSQLRTLEQEGLFVKSVVRGVNPHTKVENIPRDYQEARLEIFRHRNQAQSQIWSLAQTIDEWLLDTSHTFVTSVVEVWMCKCLPIPSDDVKIDKILEFKRKRLDELTHLRAALDTLYCQIVNFKGFLSAKSRVFTILNESIEAVQRVMREAKLKVWLSTFRLLLNTAPKFAQGSSITITTEGLTYDMPLSVTTALGDAFIKLVATEVRKPKEIPERVRDYAYVYDDSTIDILAKEVRNGK
jgi:hypothetical protein